MIEPHVKAAWQGVDSAHAEHRPIKVRGIRHAKVDHHGHKHFHDSVYDVECSCGELVELPFEESES